MRRHSRKTAAVFALQLPPKEREAYIASVTPDEARSLGSKAANDADHALMEWARGQHRAGKAAHVIARMRHCGPPVRFIGEGVCEPIGVGPADFQGQLTRRYGSVSVAVEAKSREGRLSFNDVPSHQREDLDECAAEGGIALLLYEHRDGPVLRRFAIPWAEVPWHASSRAKPGRAGSTKASDLVHSKSIGPEEVAAWEVPAQACYLVRFASAHLCRP